MDRTESNSLPIITYSVTAQALVHWDRAVVTGGWRTRPGKRTFVFVVPKRAREVSRVAIQIRVIEFPIELVATVGLNRFKTDEQATEMTGILPPDRYQTIL